MRGGLHGAIDIGGVAAWNLGDLLALCRILHVE